MRRLAATLIVAIMIPGVAFGADATTTGSVSCASLAQGAADGLNARMLADQTSITAPKSVTTMTCLTSFFNGDGLNMVTNMLNPGNLIKAVEGQICTAVSQEWQSIIGSAQCGLTLTGFDMGFGFSGVGVMCPRLSFGGGGPPLGSVSTSISTQSALGSHASGTPTVPTGYPVAQSGGLY